MNEKTEEKVTRCFTCRKVTTAIEARRVEAVVPTTQIPSGPAGGAIQGRPTWPSAAASSAFLLPIYESDTAPTVGGFLRVEANELPVGRATARANGRRLVAWSRMTAEGLTMWVDSMRLRSVEAYECPTCDHETQRKGRELLAKVTGGRFPKPPMTSHPAFAGDHFRTEAQAKADPALAKYTTRGDGRIDFGIDKLRAAARLFDNGTETFAQKWNARELLNIHTAYQACGWDVPPCDWTEEQAEAAAHLRAVPSWDDEGHALGVNDCHCSKCDDRFDRIARAKSLGETEPQEAPEGFGEGWEQQ